MKYKFEPTLGVPLYHGWDPYQKVVNNGCTIETQNVSLLAQLAADERDRTKAPIDWWLFKPGETVLIDNYGNRFACTMNNNGKWITLVKIIG